MDEPCSREQRQAAEERRSPPKAAGNRQSGVFRPIVCVCVCVSMFVCVCLCMCGLCVCYMCSALFWPQHFLPSLLYLQHHLLKEDQQCMPWCSFAKCSLPPC